MKIRRTIALLIPVLGLASAGHAATDFVDTAPVISATPIVDRIPEQRQECAAEPMDAPRPQRERSMVAPILGGVAGAILGRQVGGGSGRDIATAAGAVIGTVAGDRVANPDSNRSMAGAAVGGIAGAIVGKQVGQGNGNAVATAAGAIGGAMVGDRIDNRQVAQGGSVQRCRTVESMREVVRGYDVVYRYGDRDIRTTLPYDPGRSVRVGVGIVNDGPTVGQPAPVDRSYGAPRNDYPPERSYRRPRYEG